MPAVNFRKVVLHDLPKILQINQEFVPHVGEISKDWLEKYMKAAAHFEVVEIGGELAGFFIAMLPDTDYPSENFIWFKKNSKDFIYVDRIAVAKKAQGLKVGSEFYERVFKQYSGKVSQVTCEVNLRPENPQSLAFHQKMGFIEVGQQETKNGAVRVSLLARKI